MRWVSGRMLIVVISTILAIQAAASAGSVAITEDGDLVILEEDKTWRLEMPSEKTCERALDDSKHRLWSHPDVVKETGAKPLEELGKETAERTLGEIRDEGLKKHEHAAEKIARLSERILAEDKGDEVDMTGDLPDGRVAVDEEGNAVLLMDDGSWRLEAPNQTALNLALNNRRHEMWSHPATVEILGGKTPFQLDIRESRDVLRQSKRRSLAARDEEIRKIADESKKFSSGRGQADRKKSGEEVAEAKPRVNPEQVLNSLKLDFENAFEGDAVRSLDVGTNVGRHIYRGPRWQVSIQGAKGDRASVQRMVGGIDTNNLSKSLIEHVLRFAGQYPDAESITFVTQSEQNLQLTRKIIESSDSQSDGRIAIESPNPFAGRSPRRNDLNFQVKWCSFDWCDIAVTPDGYVRGVRVRLEELLDRAAGRPREKAGVHNVSGDWESDINAMRAIVKDIMDGLDPPKSASDSGPDNRAHKLFEPYRNQEIRWTVTYQELGNANQIEFAESKEQQMLIFATADPQAIHNWRRIAPGTKVTMSGRIDQLVLATTRDTRTGAFLGWIPAVLIDDAAPNEPR